MRIALPASLLLLFSLGALVSARSDDKPEKLKASQLSREQVKKHVGDYLADKENQGKLKPFAKLDLNPEGLTWDKDKLTLGWNVRGKAGETLSPGEKGSLENDLQTLLTRIINQYRTGWIFDPEAITITRPVITEQARPARRQPPQQQQPQQQQAWYYVPGPCGSCSGGWFYLEETPGSATRAPAGRSARLPPPRPDRAYVSTDLSRGGNGAEVPSRPARVTAPRPPMNTEGLKAGDAAELFWLGYRYYWQREYADARWHLEAATRVVDQDARYWYYRALAERADGDSAAAERSRKRAAELHRQGKPRGDQIGVALERVQGSLRRWLREGLDNSGDAAAAGLRASR